MHCATAAAASAVGRRRSIEGICPQFIRGVGPEHRVA
jgi:hypothetical protein